MVCGRMMGGWSKNNSAESYDSVIKDFILIQDMVETVIGNNPNNISGGQFTRS